VQMLQRVEILQVKTYLDTKKMEIREQLRGENNILVKDLLIICNFKCNFSHRVPRLQYTYLHCHMVAFNFAYSHSLVK
jgi:hypothetical protein